MEIPEFEEQFVRLKERELEQKIWELWLANYPYMTLGYIESVSYEEMLAVAKQQETKQETVTNGVYVDQAFF